MSAQLVRRPPLCTRGLLARVLDEPNLVAAIQTLPARALGKLIHHVGLEDAGEIVALATTEQIKQIFDEDLWRQERPGKDETFDADRFALWLEIMLEAGEEFAAQKLAELPEDLVVLALHQQVLVINIDELAVVMSHRNADDDVLVEKALESCLCEEIGEYRIISRRHDGWDAILSVLLALDRDHGDFLARVLDRCCYLSQEQIEDSGGLYDVLSARDMLEEDVGADREQRRAAEGFIAPSAAASFLSLARAGSPDDPAAFAGRDPVTHAYFRDLNVGDHRANTTREMEQASGNAEANRLVEILREAEVLPHIDPMRMLAAAPPNSDVDSTFSGALQELQLRDLASHDQRILELAYLVNVLVAGCDFDGRAFRPLEAADAVMATCQLGLDHIRELSRTRSPRHETLRHHGADQLFRLGWTMLAEHVGREAAKTLEILLRRQAAGTPEIERAARDAQSALATGRPWTARRHVEHLEGILSDEDRLALAALLGQCPSLRGKLAGDDGPQSPTTKVRFIASMADLERARDFLRGCQRSR